MARMGRWPSGLSGLGVAICIAAGLIFGAGAYTFRYAEGTSYLSNDPAACANSRRRHSSASAAGMFHFSSTPTSHRASCTSSGIIKERIWSMRAVFMGQLYDAETHGSGTGLPHDNTQETPSLRTILVSIDLATVPRV